MVHPVFTEISAEGKTIKRFLDIYTERSQNADWSVVQAATLIAEARHRRCSSLVIYAALELRLAIEQLVFSVIAIAKETIDAETLKECRKKDGLFRVLEESAPKYSLKCRFCNALGSFYPGLPQGAEWDVRSFKRFYTALSDLCHSQLVIRGMDSAPEEWEKNISILEEVYEFLAAGMAKGTSFLNLQAANPHIQDLWEAFSKGDISLDLTKAYPLSAYINQLVRTIDVDNQRCLVKPLSPIATSSRDRTARGRPRLPAILCDFASTAPISSNLI